MIESIRSHKKSYVCTHVFEGTRPVLLVSRPEGDWCFLCGAEHEDTASAYRLMGSDHLVDRDPTLSELEDLPADWEAERVDLQSSWVRRSIN